MHSMKLLLLEDDPILSEIIEEFLCEHGYHVALFYDGQEALDAFVWLRRKEGIIPAFESAHAIGYLKKIPKEEIKGKVIIINLSGRGDKDMVQAKSILEIG